MSGEQMLSGSVGNRMAEADRITDAHVCTPETTDALFGIVDLLAGNVALRRALTDPGHAPAQRAALVHGLLDGKTAADAVAIAAEVAGLRWGSGSALVAALERQGVRSELQAALSAGALDTVEDELFHLSRTVVAHRDLRSVLDNRAIAVTARQDLLNTLLQGKLHPAAARLAKRAVLAKERTYTLTLEHYLELAAQIRQRMVARVTVARPLSLEQENRLRAALSKQQGREVDIQVVVDPAVLGGVRVELGDDVIDGTVRHRLDDVTRQLG